MLNWCHKLLILSSLSLWLNFNLVKFVCSVLFWIYILSVGVFYELIQVRHIFGLRCKATFHLKFTDLPSTQLALCNHPFICCCLCLYFTFSQIDYTPTQCETLSHYLNISEDRNVSSSIDKNILICEGWMQIISQ